jgi:GT2 family glycosyltransferase
MNAGIRASRGEFVFSLNNDTELDPQCLEELVLAMRAGANLGICAPKMVYYDAPEMINSAGHAVAADGFAWDIGRGQPDGEWFSRPREVFGACAGAALYRRAMLDEIGLFDPDFFISYEDADLNWRAQWAGWRAQYVPTAVVRHREGVSRGIYSRRAIYLGLRNSIHVWTKDWPLSALTASLPALWSSLRQSMLSIASRDGLALLAKIALGALVQAPRMLSRRRQIQRMRVAPLSRFDELLALGCRHTSLPPRD